MKLLFTFIFMILILKATASDEFFSFRAGEVKVTHPLLAKLLYDHLEVPEVEANLVQGLFFKNDRYLFCVKDEDLEFPYQCSIFLKLNSPWRLASYETDLDYGAADLAEAIHATSHTGHGDIEIFQDKIQFTIKGEAAQIMKDHIASFESKDLQLKHKNQVECLDKSKICSITIPIYKNLKKVEQASF